MKKILYVSDLDGSLMNSSGKISNFSASAINKLIERGINFSFATVRSGYTAFPITEKININMPVIIYNGAFITDKRGRKIFHSNYFSVKEKNEILNTLLKSGIMPIVYSFKNSEEKFSFVTDKLSIQAKKFLKEKEKDLRKNAVSSVNELLNGNIFYFTCIDDKEKLEPVYLKYKNKFTCIYQKDIYSGDQWLEIIPTGSSKASALKTLKELTQSDYIVAFGDGINDIEMFKSADECYAISNADNELKKFATAIIGANDDDGIAKWLLENAIK
ncbi:MAG: HAD family hydrolase [Clostridiales bacterium]|nr:HAD family hydrolase [Clostridiales bacterium]